MKLKINKWFEIQDKLAEIPGFSKVGVGILYKGVFFDCTHTAHKTGDFSITIEPRPGVGSVTLKTVNTIDIDVDKLHARMDVIIEQSRAGWREYNRDKYIRQHTQIENPRIRLSKDLAVDLSAQEYRKNIFFNPRFQDPEAMLKEVTEGLKESVSVYLTDLEDVKQVTEQIKSLTEKIDSGEICIPDSQPNFAY